MHELSIALRIIEALEGELADKPDMVVEQVNLQVGVLTGVAPEVLRFAWEVASEETRLRGSTLQIEPVEAAGLCPTCGVEREIASLQSFRCPVCQSPISAITRGNELEILTLEVTYPGEPTAD
jgi:hydrogenase nickel incorporation protein HypA/HybF